MATQVSIFKEAVKKHNIDLDFFCYITKFNINELTSYLNKDGDENIPEYYAQALIHYIENKEQMEEKEFLYKAEILGFNIIEHDNIFKVEINLQKPIVLQEDFELPSKFNHLVYYTC